MKPLLRFICFTVLLAALPVGGAVADIDFVFQVKESMKGKVSEFRNGGKELDELRTYNVPNNPIYMKNVDKQALMPLYDFLACTKLTNPKSILDIDSGGGIEITLENIQFAKGQWPVHMRIVQINQIELLEKDTIFILEQFGVGDLHMKDPTEQKNAMKLMIASCLDD